MSGKTEVKDLFMNIYIKREQLLYVLMRLSTKDRVLIGVLKYCGLICSGWHLK